MSDQLTNPSIDHDLAYLDAKVLAAANINPLTGLATDYLNVFNEAVMLFGLLAEMPDMLEDLKNWEPLTYEEHFARSGFQAKELAILAYQHSNPATKGPFDKLSLELGRLLQGAIVHAEAAIKGGEDISDFVTETSFGLQSAIMMLDSMVHGGHMGGAQDDIDALFD
jgi:hypothetical protein